MANIEAVQTRYKQIFFRSRAEARWALFMDMLSIPYEYEPEKYQLSTKRYIPDFLVRLPEGYSSEAFFIEVKGPPPNDEDKRCAVELSNHTHLDVFILDAKIDSSSVVRYQDRCDDRCCDEPEHWLQCAFCGAINIGCWNHGFYHDCNLESVRFAQAFNIDDAFTDFVATVAMQWRSSTIHRCFR